MAHHQAIIGGIHKQLSASMQHKSLASAVIFMCDDHRESAVILESEYGLLLKVSRPVGSSLYQS